MGFKTVVKRDAKGRVALIGPAGSGKSMTALILARFFVGPVGKIAAFDTERGSLSKYAHTDTCRQNAIADGYIRLVVTRGPGDLGIDPRKCPRPELIVIARPQLTMYTAAHQGIRLITSTFRRNAIDATSPSIKSLNYLNNVLARIEANDRGADEALMLDAQGYVAEATVDNFFIVTEHALLTPPTATNLKGVTRETLLAVAVGLGIRTDERPFTLFDVWTAREAFICGTGAEVVPVLSVDGRTIGSGEVGGVTARIVAAYHQLVRSQGRPIQPAAPPREIVAGYRV